VRDELLKTFRGSKREGPDGIGGWAGPVPSGGGAFVIKDLPLLGAALWSFDEA